MQKYNFLLLFSFLFMAAAAHAQYAKVQFSSKTPFRMEVDKEKIHEDHVSGIKLRLNQGRTYQIDLFDKATNELLVTANLPIHIHEKSAEYQLKYKKRIKSYALVEKSRKIKDPNAPKTPMTFSMETKESYAGPDGAYSKSSKTDGTIGGGNTGFNQQKSSVSADENGISGKAEKKSGNLGSLAETGNDLKMLGKALKRKKKDDGKTVVVLKSKKG
jgi:hypothetical protein